MLTEIHFRASAAALLNLLAAVDIGINRDHAIQESESIWRVQMRGANSVPDWAADDIETTRVDFWIGDVVRSAVTGVDAQGEPIVQSVNRGKHVTMRVRGPAGNQLRQRLWDAYSAPGVTNEVHNSPQALLNRFGVAARTVRTVHGCTLIAASPTDGYEPGTGAPIVQAVYAPLLAPHHRFA